MITNTESQDWDGEEIPTLVVIFVGGTVTVLVLVTGLILANTMKRRIAVKAELPEYQQDYQVSRRQMKYRYWRMKVKEILDRFTARQSPFVIHN